MKGQVYLVGAGPGDEGLITVRGAQLLGSCDCIVYDHLASENLLDYGKEGCEKIYVGKEKGRHSISQEEINQLLICKAKGGAAVVRLKGGDPYVFGRGGEEAMALKEAGICYEVVPGISSCVAALSSAGIPITHRELSRGFQVITGHGQRDGRLPEEFYDLKAWGGTTVFLMGVSRLGEICTGLMKQGWSPDTPAAVIENGTLPSQRRVSGRLSDIQEKAEAAGVRPPAVIVAGRTAALDLRWAGKKPLEGIHVGLVGTDRFCGRLGKMLKEDGATVHRLCRMRIKPLPGPEVEESFRRLKEYAWLVFTSANGVRLYLEGLFSYASRDGEGGDLRKLAGLRIAAIGRGTEQALREYYLHADYVPQGFNSRELAEGLAGRLRKGDRVLIPRARQGTRELPDILEARGIDCTNLPIYDVEPEWIGGAGMDFVVFASASGVRGASPHLKELGRARLCCIGSMTAEALTSLGYHADCIAGEASPEGILRRIQEEVRIC